MSPQRVWVLFASVCILICSPVLPSAQAQFSGGPKHKKQHAAQPKKSATPKKHRGKDDLKKFRDEAEKVLAPLTQNGRSAARHSRAGLTQARLEKRDKATVILYGRYDGPDSSKARKDLARIRTLKIDGSQPFNAALLSPPAPKNLAGSIPEFDLRNAKKLFGKDKALYTLQVAVYGKGNRSAASESDLKTFRKAAEQATVLLRRDGELAFYYHGSEMSIVTVGIFGQDDYDPLNKPGVESPAMVQAKQLHPLNLLNGKGIREYFRQTDGSSVDRLQPSQLVAVPDS